MKLLLASPVLSATSPLVRSLEATGAIVLLASSREQAEHFLRLHATTLELAILHREPWGLDLITLIRSTTALSDLPYIVLSSEWGQADFRLHQSQTDGANAYLPFEECEKKLKETIEKVLGYELSQKIPDPTLFRVPPGAQSFSLLNTAPVEDLTKVLEKAHDTKISGHFKLEVDESLIKELPVVQKTESTRVLLVSRPTSSSLVSGDVEPGLVPTSPPLQLGSLQPQALSASSSEAIFLQSSPPVFSSLQESPAPTNSEEAKTSTEIVTLTDPPMGQETRLLAEEKGGSVSHHEVSTDDPAQELPYLFQPDANSVVPQAVASTQVFEESLPPSDVETLKRYLSLREKDVTLLEAQAHEAKAKLQRLEGDLRQCHSLLEEQHYLLEVQKKKEKEFEQEKELLAQGLQVEIDELRFQMKSRSDRVRTLEAQVRSASDEMERLKERVRSDIRKIRVREKELENRLEIVKRDSDAVLSARQVTIMDLKRKLDTAEFNLDLMQDRLAREKGTSQDLREKLLRASQAVRLAGGLLDPSDPDGKNPEPAARSNESTERKVS